MCVSAQPQQQPGLPHPLSEHANRCELVLALPAPMVPSVQLEFALRVSALAIQQAPFAGVALNVKLSIST